MTYEKLADGVIVDHTGAVVNTAPYITTTLLGSGWAAVMMWFNPESFFEPYDTGYGRYPDKELADREAIEWAEDEGIKFRRS